MIAIVVDRLTKRFGDFAAVDGVSFEVPEGQLVAVLGPNGAGKTTTLEMLEGFAAPTSGTVRVLGVDPHRGDRRWRARIGLVLQSTSLDAELAVRDTLTVFAGLYPTPRPVGEVLELVDLVDDAEARVGALSGGQRRRVDVAIGIVEPSQSAVPRRTRKNHRARPRSPAASVDPRSRTSSRPGPPSFSPTHYIDEAEHLADRLVLLAAGRMVANTAPEGLRHRGVTTTIRFRALDDGAPLRRPAGHPGRTPRPRQPGARRPCRGHHRTAA